MLLRKRNSLALICLLLVCCQKIDLTTEPENAGVADDSEKPATIVGTGEGTAECPYTVTDIVTLSLSETEEVWVIGYMVGTAPRSLNNAVFTADAGNQSNILLSSDSLSSDIDNCIPVELHTAKLKDSFSVLTNNEHFRKCLVVKGIPKTYLYKNGLRNVSAGHWLDGFDISSVAPTIWGSITL